ncbi:hypothetical protein [Raoultella ornithinolytica]|jgi:hypothetical protein|uniref:Uncharacterized protein n=1 Tax=Raoultella ornithinolytica TaxID=54291 RepID=A0A9Q9JF14_RAOOR|nr:hypothetical protein [Raoultella ornithinolytica]MEB8021662.1 hypothetical protein [Raoultella ornithinolytica]UXE39633.1 hypothetical protein N2J37_07815 [Raoultella ornithinolytica]
MLKLDLTFKDIPVTGALIIVTGITITADHSSMNFGVNYLATQASNPFNTDVFSCDYNSSGNDPITQAYVYLKTLSEFSTATEL